MLAVVELRVVVSHAARAAAELFCALKYRHRDAARGEFGSGSHAGIAAADDADLQFCSHALMASHSL